MSNIIDFSDYKNKHKTGHITDKPFSILFISKDGKRSFSYRHLEYIHMEKKSGDVVIKFISGKVVIQGKNLDKLFMDLHRHKVADVNISTEDIDEITITLHED